MNIKKLILLFLALFMLTTSLALAVEVGDIAPTFNLKLTRSSSTSDFTLSEYQGIKPVYLIFWATWCPNCKEEIPDLKTLHEKYNNKIEILAINVGINDSIRRVNRYIKKYKLTYNVAFDHDAEIAGLYNVRGIPTQIIIDINGIVRYRDTQVPDDLGQHLEELSGIVTDPNSKPGSFSAESQ